MNKRELRSARAIVVKARKWLDSPDKLVKDWGHGFETADGRWLAFNNQRNACRVCATGGLAKVSRSKDVAANARHLFSDANREFRYFKSHTLKQVHAAYDRTIAWIDRQLAKETAHVR